MTLDVSSVVPKGRSAVLNHCTLLQTSETIPLHTTLCWLWPLSLRYTNTHSSVPSSAYTTVWEVSDVSGVLSTDSGHWTEALA